MRISLPKRPAQLANTTLDEFRNALCAQINVEYKGEVIAHAQFYGRRNSMYSSCFFALATSVKYSKARILSGFAHVVGRMPRPQARGLDLALRSCGILPPDDLETRGEAALMDAMQACAEAVGYEPEHLLIKRTK